MVVVITKGPGNVAGLRSHFQRVPWGLRSVSKCDTCKPAQGRPNEDTTWERRRVRGVGCGSCRGGDSAEPRKEQRDWGSGNWELEGPRDRDRRGHRSLEFCVNQMRAPGRFGGVVG